MRSASVAAPSSRRDLASARAASRGRDSAEFAGRGCNVLMVCWAKLAGQKKKETRKKKRAPPSPPSFLVVLILQDLASSEFGSADSKVVTGAFFASADSLFGSAYFKGFTLPFRCNFSPYPQSLSFR